MAIQNKAGKPWRLTAILYLRQQTGGTEEGLFTATELRTEPRPSEYKTWHENFFYYFELGIKFSIII